MKSVWQTRLAQYMAIANRMDVRVDCSSTAMPAAATNEIKAAHIEKRIPTIFFPYARRRRRLAYVSPGSLPDSAPKQFSVTLLGLWTGCTVHPATVFAPMIFHFPSAEKYPWRHASTAALAQRISTTRPLLSNPIALNEFRSTSDNSNLRSA